MLEPLRIGSRTIAPPLALAPMAGVSDAPFRRMVKRASGDALGLVFTEFVSVEGLTRDVRRIIETMTLQASDHPVAVQIYGYDVARMVEAARRAEEAGADIVDINAGCPARKVVRRGGGANLMREPAQLLTLVTEVRKGISCPLSVKIRSGWDFATINAVEIAKGVADAGADALTVHGRTKTQGYSGRADWDLIAEVAAAVKIPVIGNGDIDSPEIALERLRETGVQGLMIGRAALGDPWLFRRIVDRARGLPAPGPDAEQRLSWWLDYGRALEEDLPERAIAGRMKQLCGPLSKGLRNSSHLRREVYTCRDAEAIVATLERYRDRLRGDAEGAGPAAPGLALCADPGQHPTLGSASGCETGPGEEI